MAALAYHTASPTVVIRAARGSDGPALRRLAELDSREVPTGDVLLAETDDELVAALSLEHRRARRRPVPPHRGRRRPAGLPCPRSPHLMTAIEASARAVPARAEAEPPSWQIWTALWIVYIVWGSTYLGIALMVETMPPLLAAGTRFIAVGLILLPILAWRKGLQRAQAHARGAAVGRVRRPDAARRQRRDLGRPADRPVRPGRAARRLDPAVGDPAAQVHRRADLLAVARRRARRLRRARPAAQARGRRDAARPAGVRVRRVHVGRRLLLLPAHLAPARPVRLHRLAEPASAASSSSPPA